jgi:3D (Asp-Asp-Asp) domain-containing protein
MQVDIRRSQPVRILVQGQEISLPTAAQTVGQALAQAGISLQNLDYSQPAENEPVPANRIIKVIRVREELQTQSKPVPFTSELVADAQMEIDSQKVIQAGLNGIKLSRIRIQYADGKEVKRQVESEWVAKQPVAQKTAYGTKINIKTVVTADGNMEYWRAVSVYITSYHDTGQTTASGKWPEKGDVAVNPTWYKKMKGLRLYIPGYGFGTIRDTCPGCVGKPWIDVFFPETAYTGWHRTEMIYFLIPAPSPADILWILP